LSIDVCPLLVILLVVICSCSASLIKRVEQSFMWSKIQITLELDDKKKCDEFLVLFLGEIFLGRGSQGTSSLPRGSDEFLGIPKVPPSS